MLPEEQVEDKPGTVWDAASQSLREPTEDELFAEAFTTAKTNKLVDLFVHALKDVIAVVPEAAGTYDQVPRELLDQAEIAHFLAQAEREAGDPTKWQQMLQLLGKLRMKRSAVGVMTSEANTIEDIETEEW